VPDGNGAKGSCRQTTGDVIKAGNVVRRGRFLKEVEAGGRNGASKISCHCKKVKKISLKKVLRRVFWWDCSWKDL
jgi:hypothetical protein